VNLGRGDFPRGHGGGPPGGSDLADERVFKKKGITGRGGAAKTQKGKKVEPRKKKKGISSP